MTVTSENENLSHPEERHARKQRLRSGSLANRMARRWKTMDEIGPAAYAEQLVDRYLGTAPDDAPDSEKVEVLLELAGALFSALESLDGQFQARK